MREIDRAFLALFKDLKIVPNEACMGSKEKPNYICFVGGEPVSHREVVRMVKRYQDEIVKILIETNEGV